MTKRLAATLLFLVGLTDVAAASTTTVGDGGHGLFCRSGRAYSVALLDFVDSPPVFSGDVVSYEKTFDLAAKLLTKRGVDPLLVMSFRRDIERLYLGAHELPLLTDVEGKIAVRTPPLSGKVASYMKSNDCKLVVLAAAIESGSGVTIRFNPDYVTLLREEQLLGLVVHEALRQINPVLNLSEFELRELTSQLLSF